jgi:hypothetical protein
MAAKPKPKKRPKKAVAKKKPTNAIPPAKQTPTPKSEAAPETPKKATTFTTQSAAAKALGIDRRTLIEWAQRPGFPDTSKGWDADDIRQWANGFGLGQQRRPKDDKDELYRVHLRRETAAAEREELKLQRELGRILDVDDVRRLLERVVNTTKAVLQSLPDRLEQNLSALIDPTTKTRHREAITEVLRDSFAMIEQLLKGDEDPDDEEEEEKPEEEEKE